METVIGLKELEKKLHKLGKAAGGNALRNATASAMLPALRAARTSAPVGTQAHRTYKGRLVAPGFLSRSVIRRSRLSRDKTTAWATVGVRGEAFYGVQFVELGYTAGKRGSPNRRMVPSRPWLEPAFETTQQQIYRRLKEKLKLQIDKARR